MKSAKSTVQLVKGEDILKSIRHYMRSNAEGAVSMPPGSFAPNRGVAAGLKITKKHSEQRRHCGVLNGVRGEDEDLKLKILPFSESQT
ncbi:hypothetical protein RUM43_004496 [Polyplax serrata]|uniref:Uncharacterized protein n=1 Tax=Polyplax serrata TaxID=468196 RepID=A0AAN8SAW9_POLSC